MDREQEEMQFLGLFGIYKETFKLIFKLRKIFTQITLTLILPLSFIFLAHERASEILSEKIWFHQFILSDTNPETLESYKLSHMIKFEWAAYVSLKIFYFVFVLAFSLLSTSAVVYTIACVYTSRDITFKKVMSVVPRVWKRLIVTFLCAFLAFCGYNVVFAAMVYLFDKCDLDDTKFGLAVMIISLIMYALGFVYMTVVWQLASVVSVLEDLKGFKAMIKGMNLIKGTMFVAIVVFVKLIVGLVITNFVFRGFVVFRITKNSLHVVGFGVLICLLLLLVVILFGLVVQTVIYFVCKSYHHEYIDKSALSDHLEVIYLGDYVPLKAKDVQLGEYHV